MKRVAGSMADSALRDVVLALPDAGPLAEAQAKIETILQLLVAQGRQPAPLRAIPREAAVA
jgi:hypothetical protein